MAVTSPADKPQQPSLDAKSAENLNAILALLEEFNAAQKKDPQVLAKVL